MLVPINVTVKKQGTEKAPHNGLVVKRFDTVTIQLSDIPQESFPAKEQDIKWYSRRLKADGTYTAWADMGENCRGVSFDFQCELPGIFQVKCEWNVGLQQFATIFDRDHDDPYTRDEGDYRKLRKGDPDSFGVVEEDWQNDLRNAAENNLGSQQYAEANDVYGVGPGLPKCNIFVGRMGIEASVIVPYINGLVHFYPPVASQWFGAPPSPPANPAYEDVLSMWWTLLSPDSYPEPGYIAATGDYTWEAPGHCGILDYDGRWISAGPHTVNRDASFSNERGFDFEGQSLIPRMRASTGYQ